MIGEEKREKRKIMGSRNVTPYPKGKNAPEVQDPFWRFTVLASDAPWCQFFENE